MEIYGIRYGIHGTVRYFSADEPLQVDQFVIVPLMEQGPAQATGPVQGSGATPGLALGRVLSVHEHLPGGESPDTVGRVVRVATSGDFAQDEEGRRLARTARDFCAACIAERKLDMKLVDVEVYHDRSKIIFYFTAPSRIDFRELVKDLVREYRSRIELRQIGVRHETQMLGAVGNCGMVCCCRRFLRKFAPVTIRMAKEQNLFLNPTKISGICGRLLCCLSYEQENYDTFHRCCPRVGKRYHTNQGDMKVLRSNMFRNSVAVLNERNEESEISLDAWQAMEPHRPEQPRQLQQHRAQAAGNGLLVVSATPDTLEDGSLDALAPEQDAPPAQGMAAEADTDAPPRQPKKPRRQPPGAPEN